MKTGRVGIRGQSDLVVVVILIVVVALAVAAVEGSTSFALPLLFSPT